VDPLPAYTAVVLAGGKAARLGGQAKPQLIVGDRPILAAVLDAVIDAERRIVVGPPQPVPPDVMLAREQPAGGGPVAAIRAGLADADTDVVLVLAGDLPFLTADLVGRLRERLTGDGVLVVDDTGRDQYLLGAWRTTALRRAVAAGPGPTSPRNVD
jgi:molybdopterin-guanine dinucleotide biosynthesis protein A